METMYHGYRKIFWGFFFLTFYLNLFGFRVLPEFIAALIILSGVSQISSYLNTKQWNYARLTAVIIFFITVADLVLQISETNKSFFMPQEFSLLYQSAGLIVHILFAYFILTGSAEWLRNNGFDESAKMCERKLSFYILWSVLAAVSQIAAIVTINNAIIIIAIVFSFIVRIWFMVIISGLSKAAKANIDRMEIKPQNPDIM